MSKPTAKRTGLYKKGGERLLDKRRQEVIDALNKAHGIRLVAARLLGVDRGTLAEFMDINPDMMRAAAAIDERNGDIVESELFKAIKGGDTRAVTFYLSTKMKHRGYTTRIEQTGANGGPIEHYVEPSSDQMLAALEKLVAKRMNGPAAIGHDAQASDDPENGRVLN